LTGGASLSRHAQVSTRLVASLLLVTLASVALAMLVTGPAAPYVSRHIDAPGSSFFVVRAPDGVRLFRSVSALGAPAVAGGIVIALCLLFGARTRTWLPLWAGVTAFVGAVEITVVVRLATTRPSQYGPADGFPSGHTMIAAGVFGTLAVLVARSCLPPWRKRLLGGVFVATPVAVAWARLALLQHVPSDVIGGVVLGGAWTLAVAIAVRAS
jgi:membrane-associated phospholipid phosphatase